MVNRIRSFVNASLATLLLGASSCSRASDSTEAERFYKTFPDAVHLQGAREVQKYGTEGAKHCLVHVRQLHFITPKSVIDYRSDVEEVKNDLNYSSSPELQGLVTRIQKSAEDYKVFTRSWLEDVCQVQKDIFLILDNLHNGYGLNEVREEGIVSRLSSDECANNLVGSVYTLVSMGIATQDEVTKRYNIVGGAALAMGIDGTLIVKPAENSELKTVLKERFNNRLNKFVNIFFSLRICLFQFLLYRVVNFRFRMFQSQIFQLGF